MKKGWVIVLRGIDGALGAFIDPARNHVPYDSEQQARASADNFPELLKNRDWDVWETSGVSGPS